MVIPSRSMFMPTRGGAGRINVGRVHVLVLNNPPARLPAETAWAAAAADSSAAMV